MIGGMLIFSPAAIAQTVAVFVGAAALGVGTFLYATHRTTVLRTYLIFLASIFLFVLSFWFREVGDGFAALSAGAGIPGGPGTAIVDTLSALAFLAEAVAGIVLVLALPRLSHGLFNRAVPAWRTVLAVVTALVMGGLALAAIGVPGGWAPIALISLMYATVASSIAEMAVWIGRRTGRTPTAAAAGTDPGGALVAGIRAFLLVSAAFLPLFIADVVISSPGGGAYSHLPGVRVLDNLSVPLYFIILASGSVLFAYRFLNQPPLMADERVSGFGREHYALTDREAEVVEFIMEGFSVADAATAMKISPKTVENHLYSVYQKTGVSNRIQLFNLFENRRRL